MPPATVAPPYIGTGTGTPALMALPVDKGTVAAAGGDSRKWYTITASLRETYDDNVNTSSVNQQSALETTLSPSLLVDFPSESGDFSARYTFGVTYYNYLDSNSTVATTNGGGNVNNASIDYTNELIAQYTHSFSQRFNLNAADDVRYYTDPSLFQSTGTLFRNGPYISNTLNGTFSAQWTPLVGSTTTYSNTIVAYENSAAADTQNSIENTASQSIGFAILPKISLNFGGIVDDIGYQTADRGYTSYTGFAGVSWQALPSLSASVRGGGSYITTVQAASGSQGTTSEFAPYAAVSISWTLGARSTLSFDYAHEITPTDQAEANGQTSDRISANFSYSITPSLSAHLQGIYTVADVSSSLIASSSLAAYSETDYGLDTGLTYHYNSFLDFDAGINLGGVSSGAPNRDYARDQVSVGVRGTY